MFQKGGVAYLRAIVFMSLSICFDCFISASNQCSLEKRSSLGLFGSLGGHKNLQDPCGYIELSSQTWTDLGIDDYLAHYPNGHKLTLQEFAAELNVPNFYCGIGMECQAGQICSPAAGINWIILYAIQEWNNYMNNLYQAVETAITLVQDACSSIVSDFTSVIPPHDQLYGWTVADVVCGVLGSISAILVPAFVPADAVLVAQAEMAEMAGGAVLVGTAEMAIGRTKDTPPPGQQAYDAARAAIAERNLRAFDRLQTGKDQADVHQYFTKERTAQIVFHDPSSSPRSDSVASDDDAHREHDHYTVSEPPSLGGHHSNQGGPSTHQRERRSIIKHKDGHYSSYAYTRYAYLESRLNSIRNRIQSYIAVNVKFASITPILGRGGIAEVLKGGIYLNPNPDTLSLQESGKALAQITVLAQLFQSLNFFVTIGSDDCDSKGPNGAWNKKDELSYCSPQGLMMNIIQAQQSTSINKIQNAHLLREKYGYTTEFLARSAWECQKKYGVYTNSTAPPPMNMQSDCIFPIAVCDCTLDSVAKLRKAKKTTVEACRIGANLPI